MIRSYHESGCNGRLYINGKQVCYTIELPWRDNRPHHSCIPEGRYPILENYCVKWGYHLQIANVPDREEILFHPANDALGQLMGCIAPVTKLIGFGRGRGSAIAHDLLRGLVMPSFNNGKLVLLTINSENDERSDK